MYHVIIVLDETRNRSYYHSYVAENGNIECTKLPPYADVNKARSCYWAENKWNYDAEKYTEITEAQAAEKEAAERAKKEAEATPTNEELAKAVMEIGENLSKVMEAIAELNGKAAKMKGGE